MTVYDPCPSAAGTTTRYVRFPPSGDSVSWPRHLRKYLACCPTPDLLTLGILDQDIITLGVTKLYGDKS